MDSRSVSQELGNDHFMSSDLVTGLQVDVNF